MDRLSERWFKLADKINTIIISIVFFWGGCAYLFDTGSKITSYLQNLSDKTGNDAYSAIKTLVIIFMLVGGYILFVMPFGVILMMIRGDKVGDKKQHILRFLLKSIFFWLYLIP
jgi:hypothetical protein